MKNQERCDMLLDYFNKCLDEQDEQLFEAHLTECTDCQEELKELEELTSDLPYTSEPLEPNEGMKERILSTVFEQPLASQGDESQAGKTGNVRPIHENRETPVQSKKTTSKRWLQPLLAASLLLSLVGNVYFYMKAQEKPAVLPAGVDQVVQNVELSATEGHNASAQAAMIQKEDGMSLVMQADNLQELSGTEAYQVWLIDSNGEKFRAGTFVPNHNGDGGVIYPVNIKGEHEWDTIAVTLEPTPDSKQPKGKIILASKL